MDAKEPTRQRSIVARDAALRRLRWLTLVAGVLAAAGMGVLAALTAASTHARVVVRHALGATPARSSTIISVPEPTATVAVASGVSATTTSSSSTPAAPAPTAPSTASSTPVVVSGGS